MIKMAAPYFYPLSRLLSVRAQDANETFQYDQAGNLVSVGSGQTASYEGRAKGDRLQVFVTPEFHVKQSPQYSYDGHGNRIARSVAAQTEHYRYDGTHQLASIEHANGAKSRYEYDALGRRIAKHFTDAQGRTQTTLFVWNGDWMVQELRAGSAPITYVQHPDNAGPLAKIEGGRVYHYVNDHLGTPQEIHDGRGQIVWAADTSAYGKTRNYLRREIDNPIRFPGQYYDAESGLHYNRHRYYDPMAARYINQDPIGFKGGLNQYAYVINNPLKNIDPRGLQATGEDMGVMSIIGGSSAMTQGNELLNGVPIGAAATPLTGAITAECEADLGAGAGPADINVIGASIKPTDYGTGVKFDPLTFKKPNVEFSPKWGPPHAGGKAACTFVFKKPGTECGRWSIGGGVGPYLSICKPSTSWWPIVKWGLGVGAGIGRK